MHDKDDAGPSFLKKVSPNHWVRGGELENPTNFRTRFLLAALSPGGTLI